MKNTEKAIKECWEDNGGGLMIVWRNKNKKIVAAAWGLTGDGGNYDMEEWDDYKDCNGASSGWVDTDNIDGCVSVSSIQIDINTYEPTGGMTLIAVMQDDKLITYPDVMGAAGKKYFKIK